MHHAASSFSFFFYQKRSSKQTAVAFYPKTCLSMSKKKSKQTEECMLDYQTTMSPKCGLGDMGHGSFLLHSEQVISSVWLKLSPGGKFSMMTQRVNLCFKNKCLKRNNIWDSLLFLLQSVGFILSCLYLLRLTLFIH